MAQDIFGYNENDRPTVAGGFRFAGTNVLAFSNTAGNNSFDGLLVQDLRANYMQRSTRLQGLNTKKVYLIIAPPEGEASINAAIGNQASFDAFAKEYGQEACGSQKLLHIGTLGTLCSSTNTQTQAIDVLKNAMMTGCFLDNVSLSISLQALMMATGLHLTFISLQK